MTIADDVLEKMKPVPLDELAPRVRDGDIFLCSGNDGFSRLISWATRSRWSHAAVACRWRSMGRIMVFECVTEKGVRAIPLKTFISQSSSGTTPYPGKILLARHQAFAADEGSAALKRFADCAVDRLGSPFSRAEVARIGARILFDRTGRQTPRRLEPKGAYICSEYVAKCFAAAGVEIAWDGNGFMAPADIAADPQVKALAQVQTQ
jgi:hypothetical protein